MINFQESHRQRLIVCADDFGISPRANRNILYLLSLGKINRIAIMTEGELSAKEIAELQRSGVKLDIHLDILHEIGDDRNKRSGVSKRVSAFLAKILTRKITTKKVQADWEKQIEEFHAIFGRYPDGINSHEHVHFFPSFFKAAINLQEKYNIPYIRFGDSIKMPKHALISYVLHLLRIINKKTYINSSCVSSNFLISLDWIKNLDTFLDNLPEGTIEIACHPELAEDFVNIKKYF